MNAKTVVLAKANTNTLIDAARSLENATSHDERTTFAWIMGEIMRRAGKALDVAEYKRLVPMFGPVDAALVQLPGHLA